MAEGHVSFRDGPKGRSWFYTVPVTKADGRKGQEQKRGFKSERAARTAMRKRLAELEAGVGVASTQTVAEYLEFWLGQIKRDVAPSSHAAYERTIRLDVSPYLGAVRLDRLTSLQVDQAYTQALEDGKSINKVRLTHTRLKSALRRAVDWDLIPRNPCDRARPPRPERMDLDDMRVRALTDDEARRLLEALDGQAWLCSYLALGTGLRRGEVMGLRWQDIDFEAGTIAVRQTVEPGARKGDPLRIGPPKTAAASRRFRAPDRLLQQLRCYRGELAEKRLGLGLAKVGDYVICWDDGSPYHPRSADDWFRAGRERAGLDSAIRFHDLRHTYATNSLRAGVDITTVSKRLGHASVSITLDVYSHVLPDQQERAAQVADEVLGRLFGAG